MCITIDKWVVNQFQSLDFIKAKVEKHLSSSTLHIICTMANLTGFTYSKKLKKQTFKILSEGTTFWLKD
jgi:hypothetical protein